MKPLMLATALSVLALAPSALAQTTAPAPARSADPAKPNDPDKVVCKSQPVEGTRFMTRVCQTRAAWAAQAAARQNGEGRSGYEQGAPVVYAPSACGMMMRPHM